MNWADKNNKSTRFDKLTPAQKRLVDCIIFDILHKEVNLLYQTGRLQSFHTDSITDNREQVAIGFSQIGTIDAWLKQYATPEQQKSLISATETVVDAIKKNAYQAQVPENLGQTTNGEAHQLRLKLLRDAIAQLTWLPDRAAMNFVKGLIEHKNSGPKGRPEAWGKD